MHLSQVITKHGTWLQLSTTFGSPLVNHGFYSKALLPGHSAYSFLPMPWSIFLQYQTHISMVISLCNTTNWIFFLFGDIFFGGGGATCVLLSILSLNIAPLCGFSWNSLEKFVLFLGLHKILFKPLKLDVIFCLHLCLPARPSYWSLHSCFYEVFKADSQ